LFGADRDEGAGRVLYSAGISASDRQGRTGLEFEDGAGIYGQGGAISDKNASGIGSGVYRGDIGDDVGIAEGGKNNIVADIAGIDVDPLFGTQEDIITEIEVAGLGVDPDGPISGVDGVIGNDRVLSAANT